MYRLAGLYNTTDPVELISLFGEDHWDASQSVRDSKMKIKFCWMRKLARRSRRTKKKENIEVLGFRKIKSRIECKSKPLSYFTFLSHHRDQKRKHLEDLRKEESGVYVDMRKNICEKSLTAVLLEARSESVEEFEYEPLYISADFKQTSNTEPESSIYEYFEF